MSLLLVASSGFVLSLLAAVIGEQVGRRLQTALSEQQRSQLFAIQTSLLGLLALLLGFSFGMAESRYDLRKHVLVDETNAIATSSLRAQTIPDEVGAAIQSLLQRYVDSRLAIVRARNDREVGAAIEASERLQRDIWSRAAQLAKQDPHSLPATLLLESLNDMIDQHTVRLAAARNHIPLEVLIGLLVIAVAAMGWVGAGFGSTGRRGAVTATILSALIAFVITMIVDLDQPRSGLIRVSQVPLVELQRASH